MTDENKRIEIDDLPRAEKELTDDEEKSVTGGAGGLVCLGDGSVKFNTVGGSLSTNKVDTVGGTRTEDV